MEFFAPLVRLYIVLLAKDLLIGITGKESTELMYTRVEALIKAMEVSLRKNNYLLKILSAFQLTCITQVTN